MKDERFTASIDSDALMSAAWDNARRNAEIERAAVTGNFFKRIFARRSSRRASPLSHRERPQRLAAPVTVGGHD